MQITCERPPTAAALPLPGHRDRPPPVVPTSPLAPVRHGRMSLIQHRPPPARRCRRPRTLRNPRDAGPRAASRDAAATTADCRREEATQVNADAAGMDDAVAPPTDVTNLSRGSERSSPAAALPPRSRLCRSCTPDDMDWWQAGGATRGQGSDALGLACESVRPVPAPAPAPHTTAKTGKPMSSCLLTYGYTYRETSTVVYA